MRTSRWTLGGLFAVAAALALPATGQAQGVTTGAVSGFVTGDQGKPMEGVQVQVLNRSTGSASTTMTNSDGRYYIQGLDVVGAYSVTVRHIGFAPQTVSDLSISLGQNLREDFQLVAQATQLAAVTATAGAENAVISSAHTGVEGAISDSMIARMPTLHRNFTDFETLDSRLTTKGPGTSGGGQNNRFNAIQIDGSTGTDLFGLGSTGQPGGQANAKQAPLGAIEEYQILLAPYSVRQGDFTGALVNAVTKSGTNDVHGEFVGNYHNQDLERDVSYLRDAPFTQDQYGFSLGGPIIKDRLHYFVAGEIQNESSPASGPYFGQPANSAVAIPVSQDTFARFASILQSKYGYGNLGSTGQVTDPNPLSNLFARFDLSDLPFNTRMVARYNFAGGKINVFPVSSSAANRSATAFAADGSGYDFNDATNSGLVQLFSNFSNSVANEFLTGYTTISDVRAVPITAPFVQVKNVTSPAGGATTTLSAGTDNSSQGNALDQKIFELTDNVTIPWEDHVFTVGTKNEFYTVRNLFSQNSYGFYTFGSLDSLALGLPDKVQIGKKLDNTDGAAHFNARTLGGYAEDAWQVGRNLSMTLGLRVDIPAFLSSPGTNDSVLKYLKVNGSTAPGAAPLNTADMPKDHPQWSPRFGFNWDMTGDQMNQLRGGTGIFVGLPAYVWLSDAYGNSGVNGYATFTCSTAATSPAFPGVSGPVPSSCKNGTASTPVTINTVDPNLQFPSVERSSLGYDRKLPWGVVGTVEGMYSKSIEQFYYQDIGLSSSPLGVDRNGRSLYGDAISGTTVKTVYPNSAAGFTDVINLTNETQNKDYSYSMTGQLQKRFSDAFEGSLAYTYSRSYDQFDVTSSVAYSNWQFGRDYSGPTNAQTLAPSKWDIPHRIVATGTYTLPTKTDITAIFTGESGAPYTFIYSGDLNGDGSTNNDPIYVPKNSSTASEIQFAQNGTLTPAQQATALDNFINANPCLNAQRGQIMSRNSCRMPWTKELDLSLRQSFTTLHGQQFTLEWDCFNFLNLLNSKWGSQDFGSTNDPALLTLASFNGTSLVNGAQGVFKYNATTFSQTNTQNASSNYRMQIQLKYSF